MVFVLSTIALTIAFVVTTELMFRVGRGVSARYDEMLQQQVSTVQAATLGLLALVLGFTMSMAESRFAARRQVLVAEANAIGTTFLRTDFLPEPDRSPSRDLVREYVASRRAYFHATHAEAPAATARSKAISAQIWQRAAAAARAHPDWDVLSTYIESVNNMIDLEATRDLAIGARLPPEINGLLALVAFSAIGITGFATGLARKRAMLTQYAVPILVAVACVVIVDLDRSRFGLISTGDRPMQRLEHDLAAERPAANASR